MPKIRDLGINVIPNAQPMEIGPGGGGGPGGGQGGGGGGGGGCHGYSGRWDWGPCEFWPFTCGFVSNQCDCSTPSGKPQYQQVCEKACTSPSGQWAGQWMGPTADAFCCGSCSTPSGMDCRAHTCIQTVPTTVISPYTPHLPPGSLSREAIAELRAAMKKCLENLELAEKAALPKTVEECDAREKQLQEELDALKARRGELKK